MESEGGNVVPAASENSTDTKLSKNQLKKLAKRERWLKAKPLRKAKEKEKRRLKISEAKKSGCTLGPSRKMLKLNKMENSSCKLRIVFDLSFDESMTEGETSKTLKQLHRCYSLNRRAAAPLQIYITGFSPGTESKFEKLNFKNWDAHILNETHTNVFDKKLIVYLTSDSPNTLEHLDDNDVYVIGALVDHNRLKGVCYDSAVEAGTRHARLPIDQYLDMKTRKVLTVDQVFLILLHVSEGKSWEESFMAVVPKRKGAMVKPSSVKLKSPDAESEENSVCDNIPSLQ